MMSKTMRYFLFILKSTERIEYFYKKDFSSLFDGKYNLFILSKMELGLFLSFISTKSFILLIFFYSNYFYSIYFEVNSNRYKWKMKKMWIKINNILVIKLIMPSFLLVKGS